MGALTAILANWKWVAAGLLAVGLLAGGWIVKGKFDRAKEADLLEIELGQERAAHKKAEDARVLLSAQIVEFQKQLEVDVEPLIVKVPVLVKDNRACDVPDEIVDALNRARGHAP